MAGNTIGKLFRLTSFGESHGVAIGGIIDGCPPGLFIDQNRVQAALNRRRPGQSYLASSRLEEDKIEILSGLLENTTTGTPIAFLIRNKDSRSEDYEAFRDVFRPSHADYTYYIKYGIRDHRGGGRSSARDTASRVAAGAIAQALLDQYNIGVTACTSRVGRLGIDVAGLELHRDLIDANALRCPDPGVAREMENLVDTIRREGDSIGSEVFCQVKNLPGGLGEPVFDKFQADLAKAMLSINACNGFEIGSGFRGVTMKGSEHNDKFIPATSTAKLNNNGITTASNNAGGVLGGITTGQDVFFRTSFKPVPTISLSQETTDIKGNAVMFQGKGRHDTCIAPRAVPVVEAMACLVVADHLLRNKCIRLTQH